MEQPDLFITRQTSALSEHTKGVQVFVVVKQCNFILTIYSNTHRLDHAEVACDLLYDSPQPRTVSFINQPPIKYKTIPVEEHTLNIECKLNVLSSQHEDHLFRVKVVVVVAGVKIGEVLSHPIRSISKLDPHKKEMLRRKMDPAAVADKKPKPPSTPAPSADDVLNILLTNTVLLERMRDKSAGPTIARIEEGFACFFEQALKERLPRSSLFNILTSLSRRELDALEEISSVVDITHREQRPQRRPVFDPFVPPPAPCFPARPSGPVFDRPLFSANPFAT